MPRGSRVFAAALSMCLQLAVLQPANAQDTHLIVVTGVAGDELHAAKFHNWATGVLDAAKRVGVVDANVAYLSDKPEQDAARIRGRSTRDNVTKAFVETAARARPNDEVFVLLIGHGSFDGRLAAFNLAGPDLSAPDYAKLLEKFVLQRVVFVNTTSSSGAFLQPLAGPGRIIVTATKTGGERNETKFPEYFVEAFTGDAADRDRNGRISVLEAFDFARTKVTSSYEQAGNLLTEHAVLEDGSEGRVAATLFLSPRSARSAQAATADPALRALLEERDALEDQIAQLKMTKEGMDPARYEQMLEKLLTDLALKSRDIREMEGKGKQ